MGDDAVEVVMENLRREVTERNERVAWRLAFSELSTNFGRLIWCLDERT